MAKKFILALLLTTVVIFSGINIKKVSAGLVEDLQAQIQALLQQVAILQAQLSALLQNQSNSYCFYSTLNYGMTSPEIKTLQIVLGVSPATGYFGNLTLAAVKKFQEENGIRVTGEVGPETRAILNNKYCVPVVTPTTKPSESQCSWCGTECVKKTIDMQCADILPPVGVECKELNGVCTITPLVPTTTTPPTTIVQRYSCTTVYGTILSNNSQLCIPSTTGQFSSLEECQRVCGTTTNCIDSDGGNNIFSKGTVTYNGATYTDECAYCTGACPSGIYPCPPPSCGAVKEYYCQNVVMQNTTTVCPSGYTCQDGACKPIHTVTLLYLMEENK